MMRALLIAMAALSAAPAMAQAQRCEIRREAGGLTTAGSVDVYGLRAEDLVLDLGTFSASLQLAPEAKAKGYSAGSSKLAFHTLRYGYSNPDADWRTAGSMAVHEGGFTLEWPRLMHNGQPVKEMSIRVLTGTMTDSWGYSAAKSPDRKGVQLDWPYGPRLPPGYDVLGYGEDEYDALEYWDGWEAELAKRGPIEVAFTDKATRQQIAVATLVQLDAAAAQTRLADDVNALRKAFAEGRCKAS